MRGLVRTVLGDVDPASLGRTDYHEHLFQVTPLLPGDELDDEAASAEEARLLHAAGITAMVDATPIGLGRRPAAVARISASVDLTVVATAGAHRGAHYPAGHWLRELSTDQLTERLVAELTVGQPEADLAEGRAPARTSAGDPVRAGLLKAGIGYWSIPAFERGVLEAVAAAHRHTGAPVMVHLEHGSATWEVLSLFAELGVRPERVALAHIDRNPDPGLHADLADAGAYLGYDGMARSREWPDSTILDCLCRVAEAGGGGRILLGGDVARATRYRAYGGLPGLDYLPRRFLPRVEALPDPGIADLALRSNPARWLTWTD